jgi:hypothetical protein
VFEHQKVELPHFLRELSEHCGIPVLTSEGSADARLPTSSTLHGTLNWRRVRAYREVSPVTTSDRRSAYDPWSLPLEAAVATASSFATIASGDTVDDVTRFAAGAGRKVGSTRRRT